ncbi:MAG TPA: type II toxin-antitoxin system ParD family antitoxin, partial [Nocardioides sp.]
MPDEMRSFVEDQVAEGHYGSSSEYVRALVRQDHDRQQLRKLLLAGAASEPGPVADAAYLAALRHRIQPNP